MTKRIRRLILLVLILVTGVFATLYGGTVTHALFYFALLLPLWSYLYLLLVRLNLRLYQAVEIRTCTKLSPITYCFTLANEGILTFCHVSVTFFGGNSHVEAIDEHTHYSLLPNESLDIPSTLLCHYRGEYSVGVEKILLEDYFHLFQYTYHCANPIWMRVYPRVMELHTLCCIPPQEDEKRSNYRTALSDGIPDHTAREYAPGDSQRRIHWKATARTGQLMTRCTVNPRQTDLAIVLDWQSPTNGASLSLEDTLLEAFLSIAKYLTVHQIQATVYYDNEYHTVMPLRTKEHFQALYEYCCMAPFRGECSVERMIVTHPELLDSQTHLLILTCHLSDSLYLSTSKAAGNGTSVHVITVHPDGEEMDACRRRMDPRIHLYPLIAGRDIQSVLEQGVNV